jgi:glutathionylspermidine synthase
MSIADPIAIPQPSYTSHPLRAGAPVNAHEFARIRRRMILDCCKWDPQVGDVSTLADFPLLIDRNEWERLRDLAECLTAELMAAERELLARPDLHRMLAVPHRVRSALRDVARCGQTPAAVRVMRFDFHWTRRGWQISEVNSDVPGGFSEASELTRLMCPLVPSATTPGDPGAQWADAVARSVEDGTIALLSAPGFMEDQQVVSYLARLLQSRGFGTCLTAPHQLRWDGGAARIAAGECDTPLSAIVRFYQAEWLTHLPRSCQWQRFFAGSTTPVVNPGIAVLTESKRFPLVWDRLRTELPTWRKLLPETRDPRDAPWRRDAGWLLKTAYCNTGDTVTARDVSTPKQWRAASISAWLNPGQWVAQRRFECVPVPSPIGDVHVCIGVYVIDGRAIGAYTRIAPRQVIDYRAIDAALLIVEGPSDR